MIKNIVLVLGVVFMVGCGSSKVEEKQGMKKQTVKSTQYITKGMQYLNQKEPIKAIQSFDMAIKANPSNPENYLILGQVYLRLQNYQRAIDTLGAAVRVDPTNPEIYYLLATSRGLRWEEEDRVKSIDAAKKSIELFMQQKNQEKFQKAVVLLKGLTERAQQK
ncbi:hypothetical protein MNBD_UNCLBAC01-1240 [hydrothermal vent metagenome]|uniref:Uncharacterized protein n=1 Tax=hydrothermal vent metagenome TaxID=652676 RepID=A0A3B1DL06_9ZZZZ